MIYIGLVAYSASGKGCNTPKTRKLACLFHYSMSRWSMSTHTYVHNRILKKKSHMVKLYGSTQHSAVHLMLAKSETPTFPTYSIYFDKIFSIIIHISWLQNHWSHFSNNDTFYLGEKWDKHNFCDIVYGIVHHKARYQSTFFLSLNHHLFLYTKPCAFPLVDKG